MTTRGMKPLFGVMVLVLGLAACGESESAPPVSSCNKVESFGMCTEYRGYPVDEARMGCSAGFTEAACPTGNRLGSCEKPLSSVNGTERVQVDFYYNPVRPPHTPETLQALCSSTSGWTWSSSN